MKKLFSMLVALSMVACILPMAASAETTTGTTKSWTWESEDASAAVTETAHVKNETSFWNDSDGKYINVTATAPVTLTNKKMAANYTVDSSKKYHISFAIPTEVVTALGDKISSIVASMGDVSVNPTTMAYETIDKYTRYYTTAEANYGKEKQMANAITGATDTFKLTVPAYTDLRIDDIRVEEICSLDGNLVKGAGTDVTGVMSSPDGIVEPVLTDVPHQLGALPENWYAKITDGNGIGRISAAAGISSSESYEGKNSLYVKYYAYGSMINNDHGQNQTMDVGIDGTGGTMNNYYVMSFYAKTIKDTASHTGSNPLSKTVGIVFADGQVHKLADTTYFTAESVGDDGWVKYTTVPLKMTSGANRNVKFQFAGKRALGEIYIDNIEIRECVADANGVEPGAEGYATTLGKLFGNNHPITFEPENVTYEVGDVKLYDDAYNELDAISTDEAATNLTAAANVINYAEEDFTAQIIACYYDNGILTRITMSDPIPVSTSDKGTVIKTVLRLPGFRVLGSKNVKVFVWDSINGMLPLSDEAVFAGAVK